MKIQNSQEFDESTKKFQPEKIPNPMHFCDKIIDDGMVIPTYLRSEKYTRQKLSGDYFQRNASLPNFEINPESAQEYLSLNEEIVSSCLECEEKLDNFPAFYFLRCLLRIIEIFEDRTEQNSISDYVVKWVKNHELNGVQGYFYYTEQSFYRRILTDTLPFVELSTKDLVGYLEKTDVELDFTSNLQRMTPEHLEDLGK